METLGQCGEGEKIWGERMNLNGETHKSKWNWIIKCLVGRSWKPLHFRLDIFLFVSVLYCSKHYALVYVCVQSISDWQQLNQTKDTHTHDFFLSYRGSFIWTICGRSIHLYTIYNTLYTLTNCHVTLLIDLLSSIRWLLITMLKYWILVEIHGTDMDISFVCIITFSNSKW